MRVLLGVSCLEFGTFSILSLGDHVLDCENVLKLANFGWWLNLLILPYPNRNRSIKRRVLNDERLLRRRQGKGNRRRGLYWVLSNSLREYNAPSTP